MERGDSDWNGGGVGELGYVEIGVVFVGGRDFWCRHWNQIVFVNLFGENILHKGPVGFNLRLDFGAL
jgi:hypothetical protein